MTDAPLSRKAQIFLLALLTGIFLVNFLSRVVLAPLLPLIEKDLGIGHAGAGGIFMLIAIGYAAGLFGSGFVSSRLTHRRTIAWAAVACGCFTTGSMKYLVSTIDNRPQSAWGW